MEIQDIARYNMNKRLDKEVRKLNKISNSIVLFLIVCSLVMGFTFRDVLDNYLYSGKMLLSSDNKECKGLSLKQTSFCLRENLFKIYSYNITNVGVKLTEEELIKNGGVCSHYSEWYISKARELGFEGEFVVFPVGDLYHAIAIISDETGYCTLDQTFDPVCYDLDTSRYGEEKDE